MEKNSTKIDTNYLDYIHLDYIHLDEMKTIAWKFRADGYSLEFDAHTFLQTRICYKNVPYLTESGEVHLFHFPDRIDHCFKDTN